MLEKVNRSSMLLTALRIAIHSKRFSASPIWYAVSEICAVGSHSAIAIALEIGLDPHAKLSGKNLSGTTLRAGDLATPSPVQVSVGNTPSA